MALNSPAIAALCQKLTKHLGTDFERDVFEASLKSLEQTGNPLRLNNFATALRELSRIVLVRLAPDQKVQNCTWYTPTQNQNGQAVITRGQRVSYAFKGGLDDGFVQNTLLVDIDLMRKDFLKALDRLSKFTHIGPAVFGVDDTTLEIVTAESLEAFISLFETIADCRAQVEVAVEEQVREALHHELLRTAVNELDELATHYQVEDTTVDTISIKILDDTQIIFSVTGNVECQFQYGSGSDVRKGDGVITNDSYPLTCDFVSDIRTPLDVSAQSNTLAVDNTSFYE